MSEEKFTRGPWKAGKNKHFLSVLDGNEGKAIYAGDDIVAWANGIDRDGQPDIDTALKNANLIAAAPEMYEALNMLVMALDSCYDMDNLNEESTALYFLPEFNRAKQALKKARCEE